MNLNISRVGEPQLVRGADDRTSVRDQNKYKIWTTPLPAGPRGINWQAFFNDQLKGPLVAFHDGSEIVVYCHPEIHPNWLERVDAAIELANEKEGTISYEA
jgi:hypothetical protein